jgi:myo-inositol-1(or 4)-monophosphatase
VVKSFILLSLKLTVTDFVNNLFSFCQSLAELTSAILITRFSSVPEARDKVSGGRDIVTETDFELEQLIKTSIAKQYPSHGFWGEENGGKFKEYTWVVDPLDGTNNFGIGLAIAGTSIALLKNGTAQLALSSHMKTNIMIY